MTALSKTVFRRTSASLVALSLIGLVTGCSTNQLSPSSGNSTNAVTLSSESSSSITASTSVTALTNKWMKIEKRNRHVDLTLVAEINNSFNFDGYQHGFMIVTVPKGWLVTIHFQNLGIVTDSAIVLTQAAFTKFLNNGQLPPPAFPTAATSSVVQGLSEDMTDTFSFRTNQSGRYIILSGVPGHALSGMWIHFNVSNSVTLPSVTVKKVT